MRTLLQGSVTRATLLLHGAKAIFFAEDVLAQRGDDPLANLALDTVAHGVQDGVDGSLGLVSRLRTILVDTGLDQDAVPLVVRVLVVQVRAANIGLGSVADKVDSVGRGVEAVLLASPLLQEPRRKLECADLGLTEGVCVELALLLGNVLEGDLEHAAESTHTQTHVVVGRRPDDIVVREVNWWALIKGLTQSTDLAALGHCDIEHDLNIAGSVARIREDEDGLDSNVSEVTLARVLELVGRKLAEWCCGRVVLDDIAGRDDILEAVAFSNLTALLAFSTNNQDSLESVGHFPHGSVAADELCGRDFDLHLF